MGVSQHVHVAEHQVLELSISVIFHPHNYPHEK